MSELVELVTSLRYMSRRKPVKGLARAVDGGAELKSATSAQSDPLRASFLSSILVSPSLLLRTPTRKHNTQVSTKDYTGEPCDLAP